MSRQMTGDPAKEGQRELRSSFSTTWDSLN
jgi:hypothetical protein